MLNKGLDVDNGKETGLSSGLTKEIVSNLFSPYHLFDEE